jgi:predicted HAD superfamily Cof-like phosphohydrolase
MHSMYDDVCYFHEKVLGQEFPDYPQMISQEFALERFRFIQEELDEYLKAAIAGDMVGAVDGLLDIVYVSFGTLFFMGVNGDRCWRIVQDANMRKERGVTNRGNEIDAVKPPGWVGPEAGIASIIAQALDRRRDATHSDGTSPESDVS